MHIRQGERAAFVGESGSGKTTLVKLLLNLYSLEEGDVLINNNNVKDINIDSLRKRSLIFRRKPFYSAEAFWII